MSKIPLYKNKYLGVPISSAKKLLMYKKKIGQIPNVKIPKTVILGFQDSLEEHVKNYPGCKLYRLFRFNFYIFKSGKKSFGYATKFGTGAPVVSMVLEELIALGANTFISLGTAGSLQKNLKIGQVVICTGAHSDDGVTRHYLKNTLITFPDQKTTSALTKIMFNNDKVTSGATWTIDTPFMETDKELIYFRKKGVMTVEMEASAIFAISKVKNVSSVSLFVISDTLDTEWEPHFNSTVLTKILNNTFDDLVAGMVNCDIF